MASLSKRLHAGSGQACNYIRCLGQSKVVKRRYFLLRADEDGNKTWFPGFQTYLAHKYYFWDSDKVAHSLQPFSLVLCVII